MVARANGGIADVTYIFETGDHGQGKVKEYVRFVEDQKFPRLRHMYSMNDAQFSQKDGKEALLLQSADIFCWEWARHIDLKRRCVSARKSLTAIFGGFDETKHKYGFTASSHRDNRAIGSHYEGRNWQMGYALLLDELATNGKSALVNSYRSASSGRS